MAKALLVSAITPSFKSWMLAPGWDRGSREIALRGLTRLRSAGQRTGACQRIARQASTRLCAVPFLPPCTWSIFTITPASNGSSSMDFANRATGVMKPDLSRSGLGLTLREWTSHNVRCKGN